MDQILCFRYERDAARDNRPERDEWRAFAAVRDEETICRAFERLGQQLLKLQQLYRRESYWPMRGPLGEILVDCQLLGLSELSTLTRNVEDCIIRYDLHAAAATLGRLMRRAQPYLAFDPTERIHTN